CTLAQSCATTGSSALRRPDVPFQASPKEVVIAMLNLAEVTKHDVVYDLGCGDGRVLIAAAQLHGARGVGIDIDPARIREAADNGRRECVVDRVTFLNQDLFTSDISDATV